MVRDNKNRKDRGFRRKGQAFYASHKGQALYAERTEQVLDAKRQGQALDVKHQGQAYVEFILVLPLFLIFIAAITGYGQALYARLAVDAAAWSACRHAIATLDESRGAHQAFAAARYTLDGFGLDPDSAQMQLIHWGQWTRGTQVRVNVCYDVPSPPVPMGEVLIPAQVCAHQTMPVNQYKSKW